MEKIVLTKAFENIFVPNRKCITNADLDGLLSAMLLQNYLNWEVIGYSYCGGTTGDTLWLKEEGMIPDDCVFVDLPVCVKEYSVIDQHFVAKTKNSIRSYNAHKNKVNPNIMRGRVLGNEGDYKKKYPFGSVHFILAVLERLKFIEDSEQIDFKKKTGDFDLADLILRADRVIGNANIYKENCEDWSEWMMKLGGNNTKALFSIAKTESSKRKESEAKVEEKLKNEFGCRNDDGDCANLFKKRDYARLKAYFDFLGNALETDPLPVFPVHRNNGLTGFRIRVDANGNPNQKEKNRMNAFFSYAYVKKDVLSLTKKKNSAN